VTGKSYGQVIAERIADPLRLDATFMDPGHEVSEQMAVGYRPADDGSLEPDSRLDPAWSFAAGGVFSTVEDLLRVARALETDALLSAHSKELMWTPVKDTYGYGWSIRNPAPETLNRRVRMHSGRSQGYTACLVTFPDDDLTGIVLSNSVMADTCPIVRDLAAIVLGEPYTIPIARRAIRLDAAVLDRYVGRYRYSENITVTITREGGNLVVLLPQSPDRLQLFPESTNAFFFKTFDVQVVFATDRRDTTTGFTVRVPGQEFFAKRIAD